MLQIISKDTKLKMLVLLLVKQQEIKTKLMNLMIV